MTPFLLSIALFLGSSFLKSSPDIAVQTSQENQDIAKWLVNQNSGKSPTKGYFEFIYEEWNQPRYSEQKRYEDELKIQMKLLLKQQQSLSAEQFALERQALPVNLAFKLMNTDYKRYRLAVFIDGEKMEMKKNIVDYQSQMEVPPELDGNPAIRVNDPRPLETQIAAWDGKVQRNIVVTHEHSVLSTVAFTSCNRIGLPNAPRLNFNSPPLEFLEKNLQQVSFENAENGRSIVLTMKPHANGDINSIYFNQATGRLKENRLAGHQGDETMVLREKYIPKRYGDFVLPETLEIVTHVKRKEDAQQRLWTRKKWQLVAVNLESEPPSRFAPDLPTDSHEVSISCDGKTIVEASRVRYGKQMHGLVKALNSVDLSDVNAVKRAVRDWEARRFHRAVSRWWLLGWTLPALAIGVFWLCRKLKR